jgi:hypothetical protein
MKIHDAPGRDDFGLIAGLYLVVSERALDVLCRLGLRYALIEPFDAS